MVIEGLHAYGKLPLSQELVEKKLSHLPVSVTFRGDSFDLEGSEENLVRALRAFYGAHVTRIEQAIARMRT